MPEKVIRTERHHRLDGTKEDVLSFERFLVLIDEDVVRHEVADGFSAHH